MIDGQGRPEKQSEDEDGWRQDDEEDATEQQQQEEHAGRGMTEGRCGTVRSTQKGFHRSQIKIPRKYFSTSLPS